MAATLCGFPDIMRRQKMDKHIYHYIRCYTSALQENLNYISDSGYEIIHMSQEPNHIWYIVYDMNPRGN